MARWSVVLCVLVLAHTCASIAVPPSGQQSPFGKLRTFVDRLGEEGPQALVDKFKNENTLHFGVGMVAGYTILATIRGLGKAFLNMAIGGAIVAFLISKNQGHTRDLGIGVQVDGEKIKQNIMSIADVDKSGEFTLEDVEGGAKLIWAKIRPLIIKFHYVAMGIGTGVAIAFFK